MLKESGNDRLGFLCDADFEDKDVPASWEVALKTTEK